jgi:tetratricopeptide (TPR) repeat protein
VPASQAVLDADRLFLDGQFARAQERYRQRVLANPNDLDAHDGLVRCAVRMGKLPETVKWYQAQLNSRGPGLTGWAYGTARALLLSGDLEQSSELCYGVLRLNRALGRVYYLLGVKYYSQAAPDYKASTNALRLAVRYEPGYGSTYYHLAYLEAGWKRDLDEAVKLTRQSLERLRPVEQNERFLAHELLGRLLVGRREYGAALAEFEKARQIGGDRIYERNNLGRLYELMGDRAGALREYAKVRERFGLANPQGLSAWRDGRRVASKSALDFSNFLPGGSASNYTALVSFILSPDPAPEYTVSPKAARWLEATRTVVAKDETDLDGDGTAEIVLVQAHQKWDPDIKGYYFANPWLYVLTAEGGMPGLFKSTFDHFENIAPVDFNGDGNRELVFLAFSSPNILNVVVFTQVNRRYLNKFAMTVKCSIGACGVFIDDLDDDGKLELVSISGEDLWATVYRWQPGGTFVDASADFPMFYRDYVAQYKDFTAKELAEWPMVGPHLAVARRLAAGKPEGDAGSTTP